ncbi:uncharacterized protein LOC127712690 [Mytilus californianus]|uniref:uncharacterized protein LOC127712690 n=1 Tax=Mytilus californianus TaxID=6549 RepID=UPI0022483A60|nr:uncharacterized protein LOC127712690 [Mytilus californianus]
MRNVLTSFVVCVVALLIIHTAECQNVGSPCNDFSDCGYRSFCCVSKTRPRGRKRRSTDAIGTCQNIGTKGAACLVNNQEKPWNSIFFVSCPCQTPLTCIGSGVIDIPLGETGTCGYPRKG